MKSILCVGDFVSAMFDQKKKKKKKKKKSRKGTRGEETREEEKGEEREGRKGKNRKEQKPPQINSVLFLCSSTYQIFRFSFDQLFAQ